jgi:hypothetical protein
MSDYGLPKQFPYKYHRLHPSNETGEEVTVWDKSEDLAYLLGAVGAPMKVNEEGYEEVPRDVERFEEEVLECVKVSGITVSDFYSLDQCDGRNVNLSPSNGEWHWKVRRMRNIDRRLSGVLTENTKRRLRNATTRGN